MFRFHDRTRRRICIAGFFLLCVAPTIGVLAWGVAWQLPEHGRAEQQRLGRCLGLTASMDALRHLRPGVVLYEGLKLTDPETGQEVLRCRMLEAGWTDYTDGQGRPKTTLVLIASQPEIHAAKLRHVWQLLQRVFTLRTAGATVDVRLACGELTLGAGEDSQTLTEVQGSIETLSDGTRGEIAFRLAGVDTAEPVRIRVGRNRQSTPPTTGFALDSSGGALPCPVLAMGLPVLERLGSRSRFRGRIWANETPRGWEGEIVGHLSGVDLGGPLTDHLPHKLSGTAELTVESCRFGGGRIEEAAGSLVAGPGVISRSLLDAAIRRLGLIGGITPNSPERLIRYEQLALSFVVDEEGFRIAGQCPSTPSGAILVDSGGVLLAEPSSPHPPQPLVGLLQVLVPDSEVQVPATRQTDWLIRHLPVPDVVPPDGPDAPLPDGRVRFSRKRSQDY